MTLATIIGLVISGGGALYGTYRKVIKPYLKKLKADQQRREDYYNKLAYVYNEMQVDGNGSMKTAIIGLKESVGKIEVMIGGIAENQRNAMILQGIAFWESNDFGEFTYVSPGLCNLLKKSEQELLGNNWIGIIHPEEKEKILTAYEQYVDKKIPFDEVFSTKHNSKVWAVSFPKRSHPAATTFGKMTLIEEEPKNKNGNQY